MITAGGQSRRFGRDKALVAFEGMTLLERVATSVAGAKEKVLIAPTGKYILPGWMVIPDGRPGEGPLAGLETALQQAETEWVAFAGVDLPLLTPDYWERLLAARTVDVQAVQAVHPQRGPQPLAALYHVSLLPDLTRMLDAGERRLRQATPPQRTALVSGFPEHYFANVNRPEDLRHLSLN